ncbi:MAG: YhjD/YihY/BrkB family envelope integrity protein [Planctomycetota bacterium]|nr:YhjD/YihY/BrkB family envelope integrity protein [Planctomycetota bacterium]
MNTTPSDPETPKTPDEEARSLRERVQSSIRWIRQAAHEPRRNLDEVQQKVRNAFEIARFCLRHLAQDRAPQMAASLAFRTLFGILPVLVVVTVAARSLLGSNFQNITGQMIDALGLNEIRIIPPQLDTTQQAKPVGLGEWVDGFVSTAANINLAGLGWIGMIVVLFSALWVMVTIENSFNVIYRARNGRSWTRRLLVYWCVLTLGPVLLGVMPWIWGNLASVLATLPKWTWLAVTVDVVSSVFMFWILMFVIYLWVPNARVRIRPAMIGAFVAALLLEGGKRSLGAYMANAFSVSSLYGSLGLIPVFMFWMYLMWMFVLVGLEVAALVQMLRGRDARVQCEENEAMVDPAAILTVMGLIADGFRSGRAMDPLQIVQSTGLAPGFVSAMLDRLEQRGFIHQLERNEGYVMARPPEQVAASDLMDVAFELVDDTSVRYANPLLARLRDAQRRLTAETTLAALHGPATSESTS